MKKGIQGITLVITLIAFVIGIGILFLISQVYTGTLSSASNTQAVNTWVKLRAATKGTDVIVPDNPPVIDLQEPLQINSVDQLNEKGGKSPVVYKDIGNSMVDCWNAFDRGKTDFMGNWKEKKVFCFPCRAITFSDQIKKSDYQITGLNKYLNEQRTGNQNTPTYLQYLSNDNSFNLSQDQLKNDKINTTKNLYVFFFAVSGQEWLYLGKKAQQAQEGIDNMAEELGGINKSENKSEEILLIPNSEKETAQQLTTKFGLSVVHYMGSVILLPLNILQYTPVGAGVSAIAIAVNKEQFIGTILFGDQESIIKKCSELQQ